MAQGVNSWSTTAASNATADASINFAEGQAPSSVNDSARALMARVADWRDSLNGSNATTGGTTAFVLTSDQSFAALAAGLEVAFQINATNTGTSTLNVDSLGAKPLRSAAGVEVVAGALKIGAVYRATYFTSNSGEWLLHDCTPTIIAADQVVTDSLLNGAATYAKIQDVSATKRALGRNTSGSGDVEEVTIAQMLNWLGTAARGDMIRQGASDPERVTIGTAGKVWTSDGTDPGWALPSRMLLATLTASNSASLSDTSSLTSTYKRYEVEYDNLVLASDSFLKLEIHSGGSFKTSGYVAVGSGRYSDGSQVSTPATDHISLSAVASGSGTDNVSPGGSGKLIFTNPSASAKCWIYGHWVNVYIGGLIAQGTVAGYWDTAAAVTGFRFIAGTGNITSGEVRIYGHN